MAKAGAIPLAAQLAAPYDPSRCATPDLRTVGLLALALLMTGLKIYCALRTLGTNDLELFDGFARTLAEVDICALYHANILFNHTPLVASYLSVIHAVAGDSIQTFAFWLRLPGILADLVVACLLISQRKRPLLAACPDSALLLFTVSPVSFMVSGFHGNFDSVMVMFVVFSAWMCLRRQAALSGLFFALSLQVKVPPIIVLPVFFVFWLRRGDALRFCLVLAGVCAVGWIEPLTKDPMVFLHNVLGYSSNWSLWGFSYWLERTTLPVFAWEDSDVVNIYKTVIIQLMKTVIVLSITWLAWSRKPFTAKDFLPTLALAWSIFFFLTPGAAPQYMVWIAPFVLLSQTRWYLVLTVGSTVFCFAFYQAVCGKLPWYYGDSSPSRVHVWIPWMLWAWVGAGYGLYAWATSASSSTRNAQAWIADRDEMVAR